MGGKTDGDHDYGYLYYRKKDDTWYGYEGSWSSSFPDVVSFVYYWTDATPDDWVSNDPPLTKRKNPAVNPALEIAWNNVQEAVRQYEIIKGLVG